MVATDLVADLVTAVADQPDLIVADALCSRLGTLLATIEHDEPVLERPGPNDVARAVVVAAESAVREGLGQADAWRAPWQVLTAMAGILPAPDSDAALDVIARLRETADGLILPPTPSGPEVTGPVLWTRDRYGSRFAVAANITSADQPQRCYLWDIDACGHGAFTVHGDWYPTADAALAGWQDGVGSVAAQGTGLEPVDDPWLLAELLPAEDEMFRFGGENEEQFAEYHRSKRFAQAVMTTMRLPETPPDRGLDVSGAAAEFTAWLTAHRAENLPADLDALVDELADSWQLNDVEAVFGTCSPHRVALLVLHVRDYYLDEFAEQLIALLPDWIRWLAERNGTPAELVDRCLPYATGEVHAQIQGDETGPDYLARVTE